MKFLAFIVVKPGAETPMPMAISPSDDVWFVASDAFPPEFAEQQEELLRGQPLEVLGAVCVGNAWRRA